jgi:general secretion pathway protein G
MIAVFFIAWKNPAHAWSSRASRTENQIQNLRLAITLFHSEVGRFPAEKTFSDELVVAGLWDLSQEGPILDDWERPIQYQVPGKHGLFDLCSFGRDGVDDGGQGDDISNWAGVNDGFYWKSQWPIGRSMIRWSKVIGLGTLLLGFFFPLKVVVPLSWAIIVFGYMVGSQMLLHPGIVPTYNTPLENLSTMATIALLVLLAVFAFNLRRYIFRKRNGIEKG